MLIPDLDDCRVVMQKTHFFKYTVKDSGMMKHCVGNFSNGSEEKNLFVLNSQIFWKLKIV